MKSTTYFFLLLLLANCNNIFGQQTVHFEYDAVGNRVLRHITVKELKAGDSLLLSPELPVNPADTPLSEGEATFIVYPNPSPEVITIENSGAAITGKLSYQLFDSQGKMQLQGDSPTVKTMLNMQQLQSGTYLLRLRYDGKMQVFRVIKQ